MTNSSANLNEQWRDFLRRNLDARSIAIVVLSTTSWPRIQLALSDVVTAIERALPAGYLEVLVK